jgi:hypothetical protein
MCFVLYAGTMRPLPQSEWNKEKPGLYVRSLTEREDSIRAYFSSPEVQYIGSTSGCGCDFPHLMLQNGDWPFFENEATRDAEQDASDQSNREALVTLLEASGDQTIELYGVWDGNYSEPQAREQLSLKRLLKPDFRFKEQGFYIVRSNER